MSSRILPFLLLAACAGHTNPALHPDARVAHDIERLRTATRPYQALDAAGAAGYAKVVRDCLVHEHHGAMGYHHVNRGFVDAVLDVSRPEILLYERSPTGEHRLNGVEFILPYTYHARESAAPVLMGQALRREDNLKFWDLHVWAWNENPDGVFADFHPRVTCPDSARKVFMPFVQP